MLRYLRGQLTNLGTCATVDVGGVGYEVRVPARTIETLRRTTPHEVTLFIHERITETEHTLYGFESEADLTFFRTLLSADKVGPSKALAIMSLGTPEQLMQAVRMGNAKYFERAPGVGANVANSVVLALAKAAQHEAKTETLGRGLLS